VLPDTEQIPVEIEEKRFGKFAVKEQVVPEGAVLFRVAVTVTHVPGGPLLGKRFKVLRCKALVAAWTGVGPTAEYVEMSRAEVSKTNR
jgi:hypothetical protein